MKKVISALLVFVFLSSCASTYFYSTITSLDKNVLQTDDGDFILENDSLLISYWFNGENAPIYINVYNKSKTPLYVDWSRSALITGDESVTYEDKVTKTEGYVRGLVVDNVFVNSVQYASSSFQSYTTVPESVSFIAPNSRRTFNTRHLASFDFSGIEDRNYSKAVMSTKDSTVTKVKVLKFSEETTPLKFRSYLTLYKDSQKPFTMEQAFYISSLIKSNSLSPSNMNDEMFKRGDLFYVVKENNTGRNILLGAAVVGLVVVDAALDAKINSNNNR